MSDDNDEINRRLREFINWTAPTVLINGTPRGIPVMPPQFTDSLDEMAMVETELERRDLFAEYQREVVTALIVAGKYGPHDPDRNVFNILTASAFTRAKAALATIDLANVKQR